MSHPPADPLPIDGVLEAVHAALGRAGAVVVEASPGAGKTTRVPAALRGRGEVLVLEPRRLAARLAAARVAAELGEPLGGKVGYQVRFETRASARTELRFVTEALLTRRLMRDPHLRGVAVVVVDEVHERHLHTDLALALCDRLRRGPRPDLQLVVMSATLDAEHVAARYDAALVRCEAPRHEVRVEHVAERSREPLDVQVATAVRALCRAGLDGHVLAFLPGAGEIRRAAERCRAVAADHDLEVLPLHGEQPRAEQDRAVAPSSRRKLILATNVAESSITIDGVAAVIDSGLVKVARALPWAMAASLELQPISQASAAQRAGRAGRTRAGRCLRLYTAGELERAPRFDTPEIERVELSELVLAAMLGGADDVRALRWLSPPAPERLAAAEALLCELGAASDGGVTELGRAIAELPVHPRAGRVIVEAARRGVAAHACDAMAIVYEGGVMRRGERVGPAGARGHGGVAISDHLEALSFARDVRFDHDALAARAIDARRARAADRAARQLAPRGRARAGDQEAGDEDAAVNAALLAGFGDRVAKRAGAAGEIALAGGGRARLADAAAIGADGFTLVLDAIDTAGQPVVTLAAPIGANDVLEARIDEIREERVFEWNEAAGAAVVVERWRYRELTLLEQKRRAPAGPEAGALLLAAARRRGVAREVEVARLAARSRWAAAHGGGLTPLDAAAVERALGELAAGAAQLDEITPSALAALLLAGMAAGARRDLDRLAPERLRLASGVELPVHYPGDGPPFVESYLQDFFGIAETPRIAGEPLVVHLWAPNRRAEQVTRDLPSFWREHYPALRRRLMRRYPKHHFPDDPLAARAVRLKHRL